MNKKKQQENKKTANKQALVKKEDKAIIKKMTVEEAKDFIKEIAYIDGEPKRIMKELSEDLLPQIKAGKANKKVREKTTETVSKALIVYGLETHYPLAETVNKKYRPLVIEFSNQLIQEYKCQTSSEKALAEIVANAYMRVLEFSELMNSVRRNLEDITNIKNGLYSILSKELDRANRQFITAITTLKQIKTPSLEINVKTKAAFIAQNQQLNTNPANKNNLNKNENIEPK